MSTLEASFERKNVVDVRLKPYAHIDYRSQEEVPESHAWEQSDDPYHAHPVAEEHHSLPTFDLRDSPDVLLPQLHRACRQWGAFQLMGHDIPMDLLRRVESECRHLFQLPDERKRAALRPADGISGYGNQAISKHFSKSFWSECYTMAGDLTEEARKIWTSDDDHRRFCEVMVAYREKVRELSLDLVQLLLASMGSSLDETGWLPEFKDAHPVLHANWYPACPNPSRAMGLAPHTDSSLITIMHQCNASGFQVMSPPEDLLGHQSSRWVTVPRSTPGVLVVNLGDVFRIVSNGLYRSALHRAVVNRESERHTLVAFVGPPTQAKIAVLKSLLAPGESPKYDEMTWAEYIAAKLKTCPSKCLFD